MGIGSVEKVSAAPAVTSPNSDDNRREHCQKSYGEKPDTGEK
jgi:hypothetical protein